MTTTYTWAISNLERHTNDGWLHSKLDVPAIEAALQAQLDEQAAPTKAAGVPWA